MEYFYKAAALRDMKRFPIAVRKQIVEKLDFYTNHHDPLRFAKRLHDVHFGEWRFRIGDYRVIFDINRKNNIVILRVGHRKNVYE